MAEPSTTVGNRAKQQDSAREEVADSTEIMAEVARLAMDQGEEAFRLTLGAIAAAQTPVAERTFTEGIRLTENMTRMAQAYLQAGERTLTEFEAIALSGMQAGAAVQQFQRVCADFVQKSFRRLGETPEAVLRCNSPVEVAHWQRDQYVNTVRDLVEANLAILKATSQLAQEAMHPLQRRHSSP